MANFPMLPSSIPSSLLAIDYESQPLEFVQELSSIVNSVYPKLKTIGTSSNLGGNTAYVVTGGIVNLVGNTFPVKAEAGRVTFNDEGEIYDYVRESLSLKGAEYKIDAVVRALRKVTKMQLQGTVYSVPAKGYAKFDFTNGNIYLDATISASGSETYVFGLSKVDNQTYTNEADVIAAAKAMAAGSPGVGIGGVIDPVLYYESGSSYGKKLQKSVEVITGLKKMTKKRPPSSVKYDLPFIFSNGDDLCHTVYLGYVDGRGWIVSEIFVWVDNDPDGAIENLSRLPCVMSCYQQDPKNSPSLIFIKLKPEYASDVSGMLDNLKSCVVQLKRAA
jgi:hypothetical protein